MSKHPLSTALGGLFFLTGFFFLNFTSRIIFSPLLPVIEKEMGIDHAQSGSFFLCISAGYFLSVLFSGCVSARINHKRTIVLSSLGIGGAHILLSTCTTLLSFQAGLFVLGLGAGLYFPSGLATISDLVPSAYLSRGMAIHELAPNIGFVAAPLICDAFLTYLEWRQGLVFFALFIITGGIAYGLSSYGNTEKGTAPDLSGAKVFFRMPIFWGMVALFSLAICSTLGVYAMAPLFLVNDHGMEPGKANSLLAFSRVSAILMPLVGGWLGDRFGKQLVMAVILFSAGLTTVALAAATTGIWVTVLIILQPLLAVCFFPAGFAELSKLGPSQYKNLAVSLCLPLSFLIGAGLMPTLIGVVGDAYSISGGFFLVGLLMIAGGGCSLIVTFLNRKKMLV
jgi:NNP family nitrate/nitrite transporter-like MFS transporter